MLLASLLPPWLLCLRPRHSSPSINSLSLGKFICAHCFHSHAHTDDAQVLTPSPLLPFKLQNCINQCLISNFPWMSQRYRKLNMLMTKLIISLPPTQCKRGASKAPYLDEWYCLHPGLQDLIIILYVSLLLSVVSHPSPMLSLYFWSLSNSSASLHLLHNSCCHHFSTELLRQLSEWAMSIRPSILSVLHSTTTVIFPQMSISSTHSTSITTTTTVIKALHHFPLLVG